MVTSQVGPRPIPCEETQQENGIQFLSVMTKPRIPRKREDWANYESLILPPFCHTLGQWPRAAASWAETLFQRWTQEKRPQGSSPSHHQLLGPSLQNCTSKHIRNAIQLEDSLGKAIQEA